MTEAQTQPRCCFEVFTLFPAAIEGFCAAGLLGRAIEQGLMAVQATDYRDFTTDRHRTADDSPFGGGAGMVIKPGPVVEAMEHVAEQRGPFHRVLLTPSAPRFDQRAAARLAALPRIGLLCGRYEGIDDRVREHWVDECFSLGDFVLNGGEVAALAIIEAVARLQEGVVGNPESVWEDSFGHTGEVGLLEHPHYTRPAEFRGHRVPPVLLGGDHQAIARWRHREALERTWALRPDLRPRHHLAPDHPIWIAVPPEAQPAAAALGELVRAHGAAGVAVVGAGPEQLPPWLEATGGRTPVVAFGDGRALRRRLRRMGSGDPHVVVLADPEAMEGLGAPRCERPEVLLDVLSGDADGTLGPLIFWPGPGPVPRGLPVHAIYAPSEDDLTPASPAGMPPGLAIDGAIAQSPGPRPPTAALVHTALTQLTDRG